MKRKRVTMPRRRCDVSNPIRERRFALRLTIVEVARAARMSVTRTCYVERNLGPSGYGPPHPEDVEALDRAVTALAAAAVRS